MLPPTVAPRSLRDADLWGQADHLSGGLMT